MIEVEIKVIISDPDQIRKKFDDSNGVYKLSLHHEDTYFNMPKGLRDFKKTDEALRLRKSIEFNRENGLIPQKINYFITYKGRKIDKTTKTREEIEVKLNETENMKNLLNLLGFQEVFTVIKERELYDFKFQDTRIEALIDYLPILEQYFIEVEILAETINKVEKAKDILFQFLENFGFKKEESIRTSYLELVMIKLNRE